MIPGPTLRTVKTTWRLLGKFSPYETAIPQTIGNRRVQSNTQDQSTTLLHNIFRTRRTLGTPQGATKYVPRCTTRGASSEKAPCETAVAQIIGDRGVQSNTRDQSTALVRNTFRNDCLTGVPDGVATCIPH